MRNGVEPQKATVIDEVQSEVGSWLVCVEVLPGIRDLHETKRSKVNRPAC